MGRMRALYCAGHLWPGPRDFAPFTREVQGKQGRLHDNSESRGRTAGIATEAQRDSSTAGCDVCYADGLQDVASLRSE